MLPGDRYIAGLWKSRLLYGLCWNVSTFDKVPRSRPDVDRAASWSWASADAQIIISHMPPHSTAVPDNEVQIMEVHIEYEPHNAFGRVVHGHLRLRGLRLPVYLDSYPDWDGDGDDDEEALGTFRFFLQEVHRASGSNPCKPWDGQTRTRWLDILDPSYYASLRSQPPSPQEDNTSPTSQQPGETPSPRGDDAFDWDIEAPGWTCVPFARLNIPPGKDEFLDDTGRFCMGVLVISEFCFLLLQPRGKVEGAFQCIGIATPSWIYGRRFSGRYVRENSREILIV